MTRKLMLTMLFFLLISIPVCAVSAEDYGISAVEEALPENARKVLGDVKSTEISIDGVLEMLWDYAADNVRNEAASIVRPVVAVVVIALLCSVADSAAIQKDVNYVNLGACLAIAAVAVGDVKSVISLGKELMSQLADFSRVLLPTLSTVAASAGAISSAGAKYAATVMFLDVLLAVSDKLILPMVGVYTAAVVASSATGDGRLKAAVKFMKWLCKTSMTALVAGFTAYLSLTGIASSGADAAATKAAKAMISTMLPVVGKMVSDASESLVAGAGVIRNSVGIFGLAAVIALCTIPFFALGLRYVLFKAAAAIASMIAGERVGALVEGISTAYGMVLALVGTGAVFIFISILSMIRTVV